jgi:hypothetical protein
MYSAAGTVAGILMPSPIKKNRKMKTRRAGKPQQSSFVCSWVVSFARLFFVNELNG